MTKNELMTMKENAFNYEFKPAEIKINDYKGLVERADIVAKHYDSLVLTNSSLSEINETHRELNSFVKGLEEGRLNVKREYNKPLSEFESKIKSVVKTLEKPLQNIKDARDEILKKEEELRQESLIDYLERQLKDSNVRVEDLTIEDSWTNKGNWTEKLNPRKKLTEEIIKQIELMEEEHKRKLADREVLERFLDEKEMDHEGWTSQLEFRDSLSIIQEIQRAEDNKKKKEQAAKEATKREEVKKRENPAEDGISQVFQEVKQLKPELVTETIKVTGTVEQLKNLSQYLDKNQINYIPVPEADYAKDDLPF